MLTYLLTYLPI